MPLTQRDRRSPSAVGDLGGFMTDGSQRPSRRKLFRVDVPRAAVVLALIAVAGSVAGANLARAAGPPFQATQLTPDGNERLCSGPLPGYVACFAERVPAASSSIATPSAATAVVSGYGP